MASAPPFAAVLEGLPGAEGCGADSLQGGRGGAGLEDPGCGEGSAPPGRRQRLHCTIALHPLRATSTPILPPPSARSPLPPHRCFGSFRAHSVLSVQRSGDEPTGTPPPSLSRRAPPPLTPRPGASLTLAPVRRGSAQDRL
jgi:hypothetical protein